MTAKEQVLKVYKDAFIERQYTPNIFYCIIYGYRCLGTGNTEEQAWQSALTKINENGTKTDTSTKMV